MFVCAAALTCGVSFILLFEGTCDATNCATAVCQQVEAIRQNYVARRYVFPDPNYNVAIGVYLNDLDRKIAYYENIRRYYPSHAVWTLAVDQLRQNYLTALNVFVRSGVLVGGSANGSQGSQTAATNTDATDTNAAGQPSAAASAGTAGQSSAAAAGSVATKRIIATFSNGHRYSWKYYPASAGGAARIESEGRLP